MRECTTHHHACTCREAEFKEAKARLAEYEKNFTELQVEVDQEIAHRRSVEMKLKLAEEGLEEIRDLKEDTLKGTAKVIWLNGWRKDIAIKALAQIKEKS